MSNKPKMTKDTIPENFTLSLAFVDSLPVLFFGGSMIVIGLLFGSPLFLIGAALCFWAGAAKVLWKIIVVTKKKNIWWMFLQIEPAFYHFHVFFVHTHFVASLILSNGKITANTGFR